MQINIIIILTFYWESKDTKSTITIDRICAKIEIYNLHMVYGTSDWDVFWVTQYLKESNDSKPMV